MRSQELNLLIVFDAIMTEGSVTKAADRLSMTQPAVSNAVSRMRHFWKDELFVKDGRKIQPTLFARNLWAEVKDPLNALSQAVEPRVFDPLKSDRTFRICAADGVVEIAWGPMRSQFEKLAPKVSLHAVPYNIVNGQQMLEDAEVDLVIATMDLMPMMLTTEFLFDSQYICVMRSDNPLADKNLTLKRFAEADHLLVSLSGDVVGPTDHELAQHNLKRRVVLSVNSFASATKALLSGNLIAMLPSISVEEFIRSGELVVKKVPINMPTARVGAFWHTRQELDPGLVWLRKILSKTIKQRVSQHQLFMKEFCGLG